jgi:hypothetical protein
MVSGDRVTMRQRHLPTKEVFYDAGDTANTGGLYPEGLEIDANGEDAYIRVHVPHDFDTLVEIVLVVIPIVAVNPMWIQVQTEYNVAGENYNVNTETLYFSFEAIVNRITEIDISEAVDTRALKAGDYIIITPSRQAVLPVANTDCYVTGVRFRYGYR